MRGATLRLRGLTRRFGDVLAVDDLNLDLDGPGVIGLLGENGAGKTTTLKLVCGRLSPTSGEVLTFGHPLDQDARRRMGVLPQDPGFYPFLTGEETLHLVGDLLGLPRADARREAGLLLERVGLDGAKKRRVGGYSGGMKQRLGVAQALMGDPELLLLDEPVAALDPSGRVFVLELIQELGKKALVVMSTHILVDVEKIAAEVVILRGGRLIARATPSALKAGAARPLFEVTLAGDLREHGDLAEALAAVEGAVRAEPTEVAGRFRVAISDEAAFTLALPRFIAARRLHLAGLRRDEPTLEDVFLGLRDDDVPSVHPSPSTEAGKGAHP